MWNVLHMEGASLRKIQFFIIFSLFSSFLTKKCVTACRSPSHVDGIRMVSSYYGNLSVSLEIKLCTLGVAVLIFLEGSRYRARACLIAALRTCKPYIYNAVWLCGINVYVEAWTSRRL